ncbi:AGE family epimerase/isomerase [Zunongwangia sp. HGR-M22]|uniref:AGE family epimerase/isomerase n=1 Tax=Zunongwangia sp. HGR-M22 TaxID=3015168 RepID=UPI0022DE8F3B|nr:AGE family epimerase/isomerase [Zunongwangia sp. HGR-M22]WBL24931.1 AGE family epimerase/isomerase [Zunongwangia sp. HGR-M22]
MEILQTNFKKELFQELINIVNYWKENSLDIENDGFIGRRDHFNKPDFNADKGVILNTRLLWTFSRIANFKPDFSTEKEADRAFEYLKHYFKDAEFGGVYWVLDYQGNPLNTRKQIYAQAFLIYALSEYYKFSKNEEALNWALEVFKLIEKHALDKEFGGYIEAFNQDWSPIEDMRLSEKDLNASKTMNTHLHILEAYTTLAEVTHSDKVKKALQNLINLHLEKFFNAENGHFQLFFDTQWNLQNHVVSYGHDIEATWLLLAAANQVNNKNLIEKVQKAAIQIADVFLAEAYKKSEGIINEKDLETNHVDTDRHWWPQAEAMLGLAYANNIQASEKYREAIEDIWDFTKKYIIDEELGEWHFRIDRNHKPYEDENRVGMWKCPYHNSRALIELIENY